MTKLSYDICHNGKKVKNVTSYEKAIEITEELGRGWTFKAVYTTIDPNDTPEYREACARLREKHWQARLKKELKHAPAYVNTSSVGAH